MKSSCSPTKNSPRTKIALAYDFGGKVTGLYAPVGDGSSHGGQIMLTPDCVGVLSK